jgi:hypothetical protein
MLHIQDILLGEISKRNAQELARMASENKAILDELWSYALTDNDPLNWRSAWVIKNIREQNPHLIAPFIDKMIMALPGLKKTGVKREFLSMIREVPLPEDEEKLGVLLERCFLWLSNAGESIAVKIYCMTILFEIYKVIPEIKTELISTIEVAMQEGSAGIVNRGSKTISAMQRNKHTLS